MLHTEVTIGYDVDWRKVHELMVNAAKSVEGIEEEPEPWVMQTALNDFHVSYQLNAATRTPGKQARLYSALHAAILDAFAEAGIEIMSPAFEAQRDASAPVLPGKPSAAPKPPPRPASPDSPESPGPPSENA